MNQISGIAITEEFREKIYKELAEVMLHGLESGQITVEESKALSRFVLDHLDNAQTYAEFSNFLKELVDKWPVYKAVSLQLQDDLKDESFKKEKLEEIREDIGKMGGQ